MRKILFFSVLVFCLSMLNAQHFTISGTIEDAETGEMLAGASVYDKNVLALGTMTNRYGFYSLTLPVSESEIIVSYIGYTFQYLKVKLAKDTVVNFKLSPSVNLEEVEVLGEKSHSEKTQMSEINVPIETIKLMPVLLGEVDILKSIQLLPGVKGGSEGSSGIYVRGGGQDQNLILLDGVPVYNVNHLFGFFSVFNADAIADVNLIKGGFPARYGGRLSSVLDISMKEGNNKKYTGSASIGIISSKITLEGPIIKDRTSFIVTYRRTYYDLLLRPFLLAYANSEDMGNFKAGYFFHDFNAKVNHKISDKDRIYLSAYSGLDKAYASTEDTWNSGTQKMDFDLHWGNITSAVRWNHIINSKLFVNSTATYSRYKFFTGIGETSTFEDETSEFSTEYSSGIQDWAAKVDFDYSPAAAHTVKFGANYTYHTFSPGVNALLIKDESDGIDTSFGYKNILASEFYVYAEDEIRLFEGMKLNIGGHFSGFDVDNSFYQSLQPRISARYLINSNLSVKAAYTHMTQYIHMLTNTGIGLPTDLWLPVTDNVKPLKSVQYAAGLAYSAKNIGDFSIEGYYKTMNNLIEYEEGASFFTNIGVMFGEESGYAWENLIETNGEGWAYGAEFLYQKKFGKTRGWIGYTLSWANRRFENISFGEIFPYKYDRRHDISVVVTHKFSETFNLGVTWVYGTGSAATLGLEEYKSLSDFVNYDWDFNSSTVHIQHRNNYRMPAYHRLDVGLNFVKERKYGTRTWSFGAYNAYSRQNPFYVAFGYNDNGKRVLYQYSLFPLIPSVSWKYDF